MNYSYPRFLARSMYLQIHSEVISVLLFEPKHRSRWLATDPNSPARVMNEPTPENITASEQTLDVKLLLASFLEIEPQADDFATSFYQILFDKYPRIRPLFAETDMQKQKDKLIESLQLVMGNVHNSEAFTSILKNLGKRHVKYGAVLTDYPLIGDALLQALEKHLGKSWNSETQQTWTLAYQLIADTMIEGVNSLPMDAEFELAGSVNPSDRIKPKLQDITSADTSPTSSHHQSSLAKLILPISLGMVAICGYTLWNKIQTPTKPIAPTVVEPTQ